MNNPNGSLTRGEFQTWQIEHQKYLDTKFGSLHAQLKSHLGNHSDMEDDMEETLKECKEEHDQKFVCKQDKINKNLKYIWVSIIGLFIVLIISHPAAMGVVGKTLAVFFK